MPSSGVFLLPANKHMHFRGARCKEVLTLLGMIGVHEATRWIRPAAASVRRLVIHARKANPIHVRADANCALGNREAPKIPDQT